VQAVAVLFFLAVAVRCARARPAEIPDTPKESKGPLGLWLSLIIGAAVWAAMVPFYFIGDDFEHLARAKGPMFASLWELTIRGQQGAFLRPVGFASIFLDYRLYGYWPAGYHLTNLAIHLACVGGVYYLARELRFGSQIASMASLIYAVLPIEAEAVTWMGARFDLLSACFTIWGAVLYVSYRRSGRIGKYVTALVCFSLATLSKENAYVFPLLLAAAEYLVLPQPRWRPLGGCFLLAAILFLYRWEVLGGIGGYMNPTGQPMALHAGVKVLQGLFLRGPALLLLGYNWAQPPQAATMLLFLLTSAVLLTVLLLSGPAAGGWRRVCFCFVWMVVPLLPAHPFLLITADLRTSRVLYLGAPGLAMLLAQVFAGIPSMRTRWAAAGLLACLFSAGVLHNLGAWRSASQMEERFLAEIRRLEPSPPPRTEFVFHNMPYQVLGIDFHVAGLGDAIRMALGRDDVDARRVLDPSAQEDRAPKRPEIHIWLYCGAAPCAAAASHAARPKADRGSAAAHGAAPHLSLARVSQKSARHTAPPRADPRRVSPATRECWMASPRL